MPQMNVLGVDVFYRDEGVGPTVVLGHSSAGVSAHSGDGHFSNPIPAVKRKRQPQTSVGG